MSCIDKLKAEFPNIKDSDIETYVDLLEGYKRNGSFGLGRYNKRAVELLERGLLNDILQLKAKNMDSIKNRKNREYIKNTSGFDDPGEALASLIAGTHKLVEGASANSVGVNLSIKADLANGFKDILDQKGLKEIAISGNFDKEVSNYIYTVGKGGEEPKVDPRVKEYAQNIMKFNRKIIKDQQAEGIPVTYRPDYIFTQTHDIDLILSKRESWVDYLVNDPHVDWDNSFPDEGLMVDGVFNKTKARMVLLGMAKNAGKIGGNSPGKMFGGGARQLHFLSGEGFLKYNEEWGGNSSIFEGVNKTINRHAEKISLVSIFGNNPIKKIENLMSDARALGATQDSLGTVGRFVDYLQGKGNGYNDVDSISAKSFRAVQTTKSLLNLQLLGKSAFKALLDPVTNGLLLTTRTGMNPWKAQAKSFATFADTIFTSKRDKDQLMRQLGVSLSDVRQEILDNFGGGYEAGKLAKISDTYMSITGVKKVTELSRITSAKMSAIEITDIIKNGPSNQQQEFTLGLLGLNEKELSDLKSLIDDNNLDMLGGLDIKNSDIGSDALDPTLYKNNLYQKYAGYINQDMYRGSPAPLLREKVAMGKHLPKDSPKRLAYEIGMQYKATLLKVFSVTDSFIRSTNKDGQFKVNNWNSFLAVANTGLALTTTTGLIQALSDTVTGEEREYDAKWARTIVQDSGMLGLYLDYGIAMSENRIAPPIISKAKGAISNTVKELSYLTDISEPKRRRSDSIFGRLDNRNFSDRQLKILQKNMPNYFLWKTFSNYILEESNERHRRRK